jgi:hypothetical protein
LDFPEQILLTLQKTILDWQNEVAKDASYTNPEYSIHNINVEQLSGSLDLMGADGQSDEDDSLSNEG